MSHSFYSNEELKKLGLKSYGEDILISRKASIYSPGEIELGDHVRIDDFCILSGKIRMGSYIHISAYVAFYAAYGIDVGDYATISGRVLIYSQNDDYSGDFLTNPMVPADKTNVTGGKVKIGKYAIIGAGSVILPDLVIGEGVAVGAMSLVNKSLDPWMIYGGVPVRVIRERSRKLLSRLKKEWH